MQFYKKNLKNSFLGVEKTSLSQGLRNALMAGELAPVVGGDRVHLFAVREEEFHHLVGHPLGVLAPGQAGQEQEVDRAFAKGEDGALLALADNQVHLPVPEPVTVRIPGPFMDADAPWQVPHLGFLGPLLVPPVLHPVAAMFPQLPALILPDVLVQGLMGGGFPLQGQMAGYLAGRPVLLAKEPEGFLEHLRVDAPVARQPLLAHLRVLLGDAPAVMPPRGGVALDFPSHRGGMDPDLPSTGQAGLAFLDSQIDCVSLLPGQLVIHSNTKLIDPGGSRCFPSFFVLLVDSPHFPLRPFRYAPRTEGKIIALLS